MKAKLFRYENGDSGSNIEHMRPLDNGDVTLNCCEKMCIMSKSEYDRHNGLCAHVTNSLGNYISIGQVYHRCKCSAELNVKGWNVIDTMICPHCEKKISKLEFYR